MEDKEEYTLKEIIESVLDDHNMEYANENDPNVRALQRAFDKLINKLGHDKEIHKHGGRQIIFFKSEVPYIKGIIAGLYENKGLYAELIDNRKKEDTVRQIHSFVESLLDEAKKDGMQEYQLIQMALFLDSILLNAQLQSPELSSKELAIKVLKTCFVANEAGHTAHWMTVHTIPELKGKFESEGVPELKDIIELKDDED